MRFRKLAAAGVLAGAMMSATAVVPAQAAPTGETAGWAMSIGGPIRSGKAASYSVVYQTSYGEDVYWDRYEYNSSNNRWYHVTSPRTGWIYCGNISAPC